MKLRAYCMDWHLTKSGAFHDMLIDPLRSRLEIELVSTSTWRKPRSGTPQIFCQAMPPQEAMQDSHSRVIWLPMWDSVSGYDQSWWNALPKHLRIVALSEAVHIRAVKAGLATLRLIYHKNPADFAETSWDRRVICYWNRTGLVGPQFLARLCETTRADQLIFIATMDPGASDDRRYQVPERLGFTIVTTAQQTNQGKYLELTAAANIFIAPRPLEGVGMTFLEAMARGSAVVAYDAPTMSEYIHSGSNGLLVSNAYADVLHRRILRRLAPRTDPEHPPTYELSSVQPWHRYRLLDWPALGRQAREDQARGYATWLKTLDSYSDFITKWA
jgi:hypothetical protein